MSQLRNYRVFEVWDRFLSAGFLDMIQSFMAANVVRQTLANITQLTENTNSDTFITYLNSQGTEEDSLEFVSKINSELRATQIRVFIMIGLVALDVFFITFIQMVQFIVSQKKMKCRRSRCMKSRPRFMLELAQQYDGDQLLAQIPQIQAHNICIKYIMLIDFGLWICAMSLAIEFMRPSDALYAKVSSLSIPAMDQQMFDLYLSMLDTINNSQKMFFEIALIYGQLIQLQRSLMIGSLVLFAVWEVLDAVLTGKFTMFFVRYICCCCCVPEVIDQQNDFLEQIKALEKLGSSYDKKIAN